jgi:hypothetical protein
VHVVFLLQIKKRALYKTKSQVKLAETYITGNLTCIRHQPERGQKLFTKYYAGIIFIIRLFLKHELNEKTKNLKMIKVIAHVT